MRDLWKEGHWIDMWTLVHFLSGVLLGAIFYTFGFSISNSLILSSIIFVIWEVVEFFLEWEHMTNQFTDIVADYAGYLLFYYVYYILEKPFGSYLLITLIFVFIALEVMGIRAAILRKEKNHDK